jgi:hypothetical protein
MAMPFLLSAFQPEMVESITHLGLKVGVTFRQKYSWQGREEGWAGIPRNTYRVKGRRIKAKRINNQPGNN